MEGGGRRPRAALYSPDLGVRRLNAEVSGSALNGSTPSCLGRKAKMGRPPRAPDLGVPRANADIRGSASIEMTPRCHPHVLDDQGCR
jgi:hypothetical protein